MIYLRFHFVDNFGVVATNINIGQLICHMFQISVANVGNQIVKPEAKHIYTKKTMEFSRYSPTCPMNPFNDTHPYWMITTQRCYYGHIYSVLGIILAIMLTLLRT